MQYRTLGALLICLVLSVNALAGVIPGRWDKVAKLKPGTRIMVTLKSGPLVSGDFIRLDDSSLVLNYHPANDAFVPRSDVLRVELPDYTDTVTDGIVIGMLTGAAGGAVAGAATSSRATNEGASAAGWTVGFSALGAGLGALIGFASDAAVHHTGLLYEAPQPVR